MVPEIARMTNHLEEAVNWYIKAFNQVRMLKDRLDIDEMARTIEMSGYLVKEYLNIMDQDRKEEANA